MSKTDLKLDWCSYEAAKYAVEHWHYSKTMPAGKNIYIGVWEENIFIGVIIFGMGSGNSTNGRCYGLKRSHEIAELVRVALNKHKSEVTRIISISIKMLIKQSPLLKLIISMADQRMQHVGIIYQAGNWIYTGETKPDVNYFSRGKWVHHRTATARSSVRGLPFKKIPPKYRYLYPLDNELRKQIKLLEKSYPKRATGETGNALHSTNAETGGSNPTVALES